MAKIDDIISSLSDEEVNLLNSDPEMLAQFKAKYSGPEKPSLLAKAKELSYKPKELSKQGLGQLAAMVPSPEPTGNLGMDLLKGTPRIAAETLAQTAPETLDPINVGLTLGGAGAVKGLGAIAKSPIAKGLLSSTTSLGREIGALDKAAGIARDNPLKVLKSPTAIQKEISGAQELADLVKSGFKPSTSEELTSVADTVEKLKELLNAGKRVTGDRNFALASDASRTLRNALNEVVPGRGSLSQALRVAHQRNAVAKGAAKLAGIGAAGGGTIAALKAALGGN